MYYGLIGLDTKQIMTQKLIFPTEHIFEKNEQYCFHS